MTGPKTTRKARIGTASHSRVRSASAMARYLGTSSPSTVCRNTTMVRAMAKPRPPRRAPTSPRRLQWPLQEPGDGRLAERPEAERRHGDAELHAGDLVRQVADRGEGQAGPPAARRPPGFQPAAPGRHERELEGDEDPVGEHQRKGRAERQRAHLDVSVGSAGSSGSRVGRRRVGPARRPSFGGRSPERPIPRRPIPQWRVDDDTVPPGAAPSRAPRTATRARRPRRRPRGSGRAGPAGTRPTSRSRPRGGAGRRPRPARRG